jgi:hypothetical protein
MLSKHKNQQNMNISLSKHSNSSSQIYLTSIILYLSIHLESLVLAGLAHVIVNAPFIFFLSNEGIFWAIAIANSFAQICPNLPKAA